ncbi:hypothetical protein ILYODFUR_010610 [Ilyodon furcidens]|uniref:Uncharacterized protein n=1 Tax=Ilyodon furcidens TaxID=33524 RepID=A0ABV0VCW0_9TELE
MDGWGKKSYSNQPGHMLKSNYPLNLITGCSSLGSSHHHQVFVNMSLLNDCGGILAYSSLQNCFIQPHWRVFKHRQLVPYFLHLWIMVLTELLLSPKALQNGFVTLSRLMDVNDFVSHLFLHFFRKEHDVLLFDMF